MQVQSIHLKHTVHFSDLKVDFPCTDAPVTLIVGEQGSGKTAILRAIYQALSWFAARHKEPRTTGIVMPDHEILIARLQSKIDICVKVPSEITCLHESNPQNELAPTHYQWQLYKTLNAQGIGVSKIEAPQLDRLIHLYHIVQKQDPYFGSPFLAYYPAERFIHEVPLINKHNPLTFQVASAYDIANLPFTTFTKFFEWFREISDIENAATTQTVKTLLKQTQNHWSQPDPLFGQKLVQAYHQLRHPNLKALHLTLNTVLPELTDLVLDYQPKLQLSVVYRGKTMLFQQLPSSLRIQIAMIGDIVRRLCILNPKSSTPCQDGEGILLIDAIDQYLETSQAAAFLKGLHQAFPRLQIICSSQHEEILNDADEWQCLGLINRQIYPIQTELDPNLWQDIYLQLQQHEHLEHITQAEESLNTEDDIQICLQQLQQQFNPQQLLLLQQYLAESTQAIPIDRSE